MAYNTGLARQLVAPPGRLAVPHGGGVGFPHAPPPQMRFGNLQPGITTNSQFTGANAPGGGMNMVHPDMPQTFQAPVYSPISMGGSMAPRAIAPIVAALMATGATGSPPGGPGPGPVPRPAALGGSGIQRPTAAAQNLGLGSISPAQGAAAAQNLGFGNQPVNPGNLQQALSNLGIKPNPSVGYGSRFIF